MNFLQHVCHLCSQDQVTKIVNFILKVKIVHSVEIVKLVFMLIACSYNVAFCYKETESVT